MSRERLLDVSSLSPPEPLRRALGELEALGEGEYLRMLIGREPVPLYGMLRDMGFRYEARPGTRTLFEIFIWRIGDNDAEQGVFTA